MQTDFPQWCPLEEHEATLTDIQEIVFICKEKTFSCNADGTLEQIASLRCG